MNDVLDKLIVSIEYQHVSSKYPTKATFEISEECSIYDLVENFLNLLYVIGYSCDLIEDLKNNYLKDERID